MKTTLFVCLSALLMSVSCKKRCSRSYMLEHPVRVYPIQESYNIGDTIWIEMNFPDVFTIFYGDAGNGAFSNSTSAKLVDFDFHRTSLILSKLINPSLNSQGQNDNTINLFEQLIHYGNLVHLHPQGPEYKLYYSDNNYKFKYSIIPNESGIFLIKPGFGHKYPTSSFGANEQDITPECEKEIIYDIHFPINRQSDGSYLTNYHIFEEYMNPALETDLDRIKNRCFTFKVN